MRKSLGAILLSLVVTVFGLGSSALSKQMNPTVKQRPNSELDQSMSRTDLRRPYSIGYIESDIYPISVHYQSKSWLSYAETALEYAEYAWEREVDGMGFLKPLSDNGKGGNDNLDIYLTNDLRSSESAYTTGSLSDPTPRDSRNNRSAHIVVCKCLDEVEELPIFIAHELNHTLTYAVDASEPSFIWEATATYIEDLVYDENNDYYGFIDNFQEEPYRSLNYDGDLYPYGAVLFTAFLEQYIGYNNGNILREMWNASSQKGEENEPDFIDALDQISFDHGAARNFNELYLKFSEWRYFLGNNDDGFHYEEGSDWVNSSDDYVALTADLSLSDLPKTIVPVNSYEPEDWGSNYIEIDMESNANQEIALDFTGAAETNWAVNLIYWYGDQKGYSVPVIYSSGGVVVSKTINSLGADKLILVVINTSRDDFDIDDEAIAQTYSLSIH